MRSLLFVRSRERTDLDAFAPQVVRIRAAFDRYLDDYPAKTARTKTSLMGPVGKILSEVRSGKWDAESLTGYALNIHLMNPSARGLISADARSALAEGTRELIALLTDEGVTPAAQDKLLDRIDYGLYWLRRKKGLEFVDQVRSEFAQFLGRRYSGVEAVSQAWDLKRRDQLQGLENAPYPSKSSKRYREANPAYRGDVDAFWQERGEVPAEPEEEDGE